jgi:hypothetical protein
MRPAGSAAQILLMPNGTLDPQPIPGVLEYDCCYYCPLSHNTNLVRLQHAVLCANCELISEVNNGHCAASESETLLSLGKLLGGSISCEMPCLALAESDRVASAFDREIGPDDTNVVDFGAWQ